MMFLTFSWGGYSYSRKIRTIDSVKETGNSIIWEELDSTGMSCAKGRNLVCDRHISLIGKEETFFLIDRDIFVHKFEKLPSLPFGVIGVYGRSKNIGDLDEDLYGERSSNYVIRSGFVDTSRPISSVLTMTRRTFEYVGYWDEKYTYEKDFWGMEDSEWIVRAKMKGCEFVRLHGITFGHFDHWLSNSTDEANLIRRHNNSVKIFESIYGFSWKDYSEAQHNVRGFLDEHK